MVRFVGPKDDKCQKEIKVAAELQHLDPKTILAFERVGTPIWFKRGKVTEIRCIRLKQTLAAEKPSIMISARKLHLFLFTATPTVNELSWRRIRHNQK